MVYEAPTRTQHDTGTPTQQNPKNLHIHIAEKVSVKCCGCASVLEVSVLPNNGCRLIAFFQLWSYGFATFLSKLCGHIL